MSRPPFPPPSHYYSSNYNHDSYMEQDGRESHHQLLHLQSAAFNNHKFDQASRGHQQGLHYEKFSRPMEVPVHHSPHFRQPRDPYQSSVYDNNLQPRGGDEWNTGYSKNGYLSRDKESRRYEERGARRGEEETGGERRRYGGHDSLPSRARFHSLDSRYSSSSSEQPVESVRGRHSPEALREYAAIIQDLWADARFSPILKKHNISAYAKVKNLLAEIEAKKYTRF